MTRNRHSELLPPRSVLRPVDVITVLYLLASGTLAALFLHPSSLGMQLALLHAAAALLLPFFVGTLRKPGGKWKAFLLDWYPVLVFYFLYEETALINVGSPFGPIDHWLSHSDDLIFGVQLSEAFPEALSALWFQEAMAASYFSYYLLIPGGGLYLWLRNRKTFPFFIFTVSACFYFCFILFIILPAGGPQQYLRLGHIHWDGIVFGPILTGMLGALECDTGAFPSSHIAIAFIVTFFVWREGGKIRYLFALLFTGLFFATVYGGPHYGIDIPAGLVTGVFFLAIARRLMRFLGGAGDDPPGCKERVPSHFTP